MESDLVYSASAFHWIPEEIGYSKVYEMLKPGGAFARFAEIDRLYARYYCPYYGRQMKTEPE